MTTGVLPLVLTAIGTGLVPLIVAVLSYRQAREANRQAVALEKEKVDREAFATAQRIYKDTIDTLEAQLRSARERITDLETARQELERRLTGLENTP